MVGELVLIGLGSNLGDSQRIMQTVIPELEQFSSGGFLASSIWKTSPVDCPEGSSDYLNAVVRFQSLARVTPEELLEALKQMEAQWGTRDTDIHNAPRELDLDLLIFGNGRRETDTFTLPHPRAVERRFVMEPAAQIAPQLPWPGDGRTIAEINSSLVTDEIVQRLDSYLGPGANMS